MRNITQFCSYPYLKEREITMITLETECTYSAYSHPVTADDKKAGRQTGIFLFLYSIDF